MKMLALIISVVFVVSTCYAQNSVRILRSFRTFKPIAVERTITVPMYRSFEAVDIAKMQAPNAWYFTNSSEKVNVILQRKIFEQSINHPTHFYGPYVYLRTIARVAKNSELVNKNVLHSWEKLNKVQGYNGVHHLISKGTIKRIHADLKANGKNVSLTDMENNTPSIFHPLHGHPDFQDVFHDINRQYEDYKKFGMKITVLSLLERIDEVNIKLGTKPYPEWYLEGVLKEAELWCKHYGIVWDYVYE